MAENLFLALGRLTVKQAETPSLATQREHNTIFSPLTKLLYGTPDSLSRYGPSPPGALPSGVDEWRLSAHHAPREAPLGQVMPNSRFSVPLTLGETTKNTNRYLQQTLPAQRRLLQQRAVRDGGFDVLPAGVQSHAPMQLAPPVPNALFKHIPELKELEELKAQQAKLGDTFAYSVRENKPKEEWDPYMLRSYGASALGPAKVPLPNHVQKAP